ncbi:MAG: NAD(P)-dependent oxidoreductase [Erysipelotrichaceae bacterium]|nr:NAD(P)-dependent oxidoreductase [Erysipelotrichaceae bacterium]
MKICWIGTGVMGASMAKNCIAHGHEVQVYNRTFSKAKACEEFGAKAFENLKDALQGVEAVFTIVGYPKDVEEVYNVIFETCPEGTIAVDMTTSAPSLAVKLAEEGLKHGIHVLDAPVSGGDTGARNATLSIMVGGNKDAYDKVYPLFECMGKNIVYMGKAGSGQHTKMANQVAIAGTIAAVNEALTYSKAADLDPDKVLSAISAGAAGSWQMSNNGPKMLKKDNSAGFFIKHFIKDMRLAQKEASDRGLKLEVLDEVLKIYEELSAEGCDDFGTQSIYRHFK